MIGQSGRQKAQWLPFKKNKSADFLEKKNQGSGTGENSFLENRSPLKDWFSREVQRGGR